jgi:hypothetical protein
MAFGQGDVGYCSPRDRGRDVFAHAIAVSDEPAFGQRLVAGTSATHGDDSLDTFALYPLYDEFAPNDFGNYRISSKICEQKATQVVYGEIDRDIVSGPANRIRHLTFTIDKRDIFVFANYIKVS